MIAPGKTFSHKVLKRGTYEYFLGYELHATAKIIVKDVCIQNEGNTVPSLLEQFKSGILASDINCKQGLEVVLKSSNGNPACVTPEPKSN